MEASLKLVVPMMALMHLQNVNINSINDTQMSYTHTALPAAMSASERVCVCEDQDKQETPCCRRRWGQSEGVGLTSGGKVLFQCFRCFCFVSLAAHSHNDAIVISVQQWAGDIVAKSFDLVPRYLRPARVIANDRHKGYAESQAGVVLHDAVAGTAIAPQQPHISARPRQLGGDGERRSNSQGAKGARVQPLQWATRPQDIRASADKVAPVTDQDALRREHTVDSVCNRHGVETRVATGFAWLAWHLRFDRVFSFDAFLFLAHVLHPRLPVCSRVPWNLAGVHTRELRASTRGQS
jgi:hypothetical protein